MSVLLDLYYCKGCQLQESCTECVELPAQGKIYINGTFHEITCPTFSVICPFKSFRDYKGEKVTGEYGRVVVEVETHGIPLVKILKKIGFKPLFPLRDRGEHCTLKEWAEQYRKMHGKANMFRHIYGGSFEPHSMRFEGKIELDEEETHTNDSKRFRVNRFFYGADGQGPFISGSIITDGPVA